MLSFASDNTSGVHPRIMEAIALANKGTTPAYGDDPWTKEAVSVLQKEFAAACDVFFVFSGTGANVLSLAAATRSHHGVICAQTAHINTDECGAPEAFTRTKLLTVPSYDGKLALDDCLKVLPHVPSIHHSLPKVLSITQSTELGTVYSLAELRAIAAFAKEHGLYLHIDGARLANAAAALKCSLAALTTEIGVDVVSFGGAKNGLLTGEAVIFFNRELANEFGYLRKQSMQLIAKMRYVSAQYISYITEDLWLKNAQHANTMAAHLAAGIEKSAQVRISRPAMVNAVFARMPKAMIAHLLKEFYFYVWDDNDALDHPQGWHEVRLMTSFNTKEEEVQRFVSAVQKYA